MEKRRPKQKIREYRKEKISLVKVNSENSKSINYKANMKLKRQK